jgi:hypothetical protein
VWHEALGRVKLGGFSGLDTTVRQMVWTVFGWLMNAGYMGRPLTTNACISFSRLNLYLKNAIFMGVGVQSFDPCAQLVDNI